MNYTEHPCFKAGNDWVGQQLIREKLGWELTGSCKPRAVKCICGVQVVMNAHSISTVTDEGGRVSRVVKVVSLYCPSCGKEVETVFNYPDNEDRARMIKGERFYRIINTEENV